MAPHHQALGARSVRTQPSPARPGGASGGQAWHRSGASRYTRATHRTAPSCTVKHFRSYDFLRLVTSEKASWGRCDGVPLSTTPPEGEGDGSRTWQMWDSGGTGRAGWRRFPGTLLPPLGCSCLPPPENRSRP